MCLDLAQNISLIAMVSIQSFLFLWNLRASGLFFLGGRDCFLFFAISQVDLELVMQPRMASRLSAVLPSQPLTPSMCQSAWLQISSSNVSEEMLITMIVQLNSGLCSHFSGLLIPQGDQHPFFCNFSGLVNTLQLIGCLLELICSSRTVPHVSVIINFKKRL